MSRPIVLGPLSGTGTVEATLPPGCSIFGQLVISDTATASVEMTNSNWDLAYPLGTAVGSPLTNITSSTATYDFASMEKVRLRVTAYTGGTITAYITVGRHPL